MAGTKEDKKKFAEEITYLKRKLDEINQKISHLESKKGEERIKCLRVWKKSQ